MPMVDMGRWCYPEPMGYRVGIIGGGLAGSEAALTLARQGVAVTLFEMRPTRTTPVHHTAHCAELVCSNSLKSTDPDKAAGMLKLELDELGSVLYRVALSHRVPAGGALAVEREGFAQEVSALLEAHPLITVVRGEVTELMALSEDFDGLILCTGPLTSDALAHEIVSLTGGDALAFYDAAAPIVMADSLDTDRLFYQSRYGEEGGGDYLNAPFSREGYEAFIEALLHAQRVIQRDFESRDLFQACQPIEEIARKGLDAPRFGPLKPVGLTDPRTGKRPWAALQLRKEDIHGESYNLVGFQTNLTFPEQQRIFRMIPGLEQAEFARFGVMHRNTYVDAPRVMDEAGRLCKEAASQGGCPFYIAGQLSGTEGYCEAMRSGLHVAITVWHDLQGIAVPRLPRETAFGALMAYASDPLVKDYQPMHVNFGIFEPLDRPIKPKRAKYHAYAERGAEVLRSYREELRSNGYL